VTSTDKYRKSTQQRGFSIVNFKPTQKLLTTFSNTGNSHSITSKAKYLGMYNISAYPLDGKETKQLNEPHLRFSLMGLQPLEMQRVSYLQRKKTI
ncbi:TPA: hypothetical protein ACOEBX_002837, partial [Enterobacter roggenkampii]